MTIAAGSWPLIGAQPMGNLTVGVEVADSTVAYTPKIPVGMFYTGVDPYYGSQEVVRLKIPAGSAAIYVGTIALLNAPNWTFTAMPNTANTGDNFAVSLNYVPANATYDQYAWFVQAGHCPILCNASLASGVTIGLTGAGTAGVNTAGKQLLDTQVINSATATVVKASTQTVNGSPFIRVQDSAGLFVGQLLSGTGIPATTVIGSIASDGVTIGMVLTGTVTASPATATGGISLTATNNDGTRYYNTIVLNRSFAQGAIT